MLEAATNWIYKTFLPKDLYTEAFIERTKVRFFVVSVCVFLLATFVVTLIWLLIHDWFITQTFFFFLPVVVISIIIIIIIKIVVIWSPNVQGQTIFALFVRRSIVPLITLETPSPNCADVPFFDMLTS